jgi:hypothetical protein
LTWSYSQDPANSPGDAVRFEMQDVFSNAPLVQDEEVSYALIEEAGPLTAGGYTQGQIFSAAARCCEALVRRFSMQADAEVGSLRLNYSKQAAGFAERAKELRAKAQGMHAPWAGGLSMAEKAARAQDPDTIRPMFSRDAFTNPWTGNVGGYVPDDLGPPIAG